MTQEDKELLLRDICGRLSQGAVHVRITEEDGTVSDRLLIGVINDWTPFKKVIAANYNQRKPIPIERVKPYLRPMSSMTEEERKKMSDGSWLAFEPALNSISGYCPETMTYNTFNVDFCLAHHFDYRGLIEKGLALEAPEGMYKTE